VDEAADERIPAVTLPAPIQAYFDADSRGDAEALIRAFAPDAVVHDEGRSHAGREAIGAWWRAAKAKYRHVIEPLGMMERDGAAEIRAEVTGDFLGSPVTLIFAFRLQGDRIAGLEIGA
jgi:ketosteroid isomerase-like protein